MKKLTHSILAAGLVAAALAGSAYAQWNANSSHVDLDPNGIHSYCSSATGDVAGYAVINTNGWRAGQYGFQFYLSTSAGRTVTHSTFHWWNMAANDYRGAPRWTFSEPGLVEAGDVLRGVMYVFTNHGWTRTAEHDRGC
jgi:hypothetical protein